MTDYPNALSLTPAAYAAAKAQAIATQRAADLHRQDAAELAALQRRHPTTLPTTNKVI